MIPKYHTYKGLLLIIFIMSPIYEINALLILSFIYGNIMSKSYSELWGYILQKFSPPPLFFLYLPISSELLSFLAVSESHLRPSCCAVSGLHLIQITGSSSLIGYIVDISNSHSLWEKKRNAVSAQKRAILPKRCNLEVKAN